MKRLLAATLSATLLGGCSGGLSGAIAAASGGASSSSTVPWPTPDTTADTVTPSGLKYSILMPGKADAQVAQAGQTVSVNYAGWLTTGKIFDSSFSHGQAFGFKLGAGKVIKGWDEGVAGMKVGERRKLVIPGALAYGPAGTDGIPPNATLIFEVELLALQP